MKTTKLLRCTLCAVILSALGLVGCEDVDTYSINAPSDLQSRIDSIAAANASKDTGDTTYITIATAIVGETDFSSGWWTVFSDYFTIPAGKKLVVKYDNISNCATSGNNYENWVLIVTNNVADRDGDGYKEYFALRSDAYGWGGDMVDDGYAYDENMISYDYPDTDGDGDVWNDFRNTMADASVTLDVDHSATGVVYVTATATGKNGMIITETYNQSVSATDNIVAFLTTEESYLEIKEAYLIPSEVTETVDYNPTSITVSGTPSSIELGSENFWGDATATVTYADGSSAEVDTADISFTVPDLTTLGEKTVIVSYNLTKEGEYCEAVSTYYTLEVTTPIVSIAATDINYYYYSSDDILFNPAGIVVTATYSDGSTVIIDNGDVVFPSKISAIEGAHTIDISYAGATSTYTTTSTVTLIKGVSQVGANDFSTAWWTAFSDDYTVASGSSKTFKMYCYSDNLANWHSPCTILRKADMTEYAVVRMDNYGWDTVSADHFAANSTSTSDWNWDIFMSSISGSKVVITVTNNGDNTADILYNVTYATGETHFQKYAGVTVDSSDLNCALVTEESYLVIVE